MTTRVVILAGGKGKRMKSTLPKVLTELRGKPLIHYVLDAVRESGVDPRPVIVVGSRGDLVRESVGSQYEFVEQPEQLGTGHAVQCAESALHGKADVVIVLYGDQPLITAQTIMRLRDAHWAANGKPISMLTTTVPHFDAWYALLRDNGRIMRDTAGAISHIVEAKDATPDQLVIQEVNPAFFAFSADWLWAHLHKLENKNAQGEFYLTDLVQMAMEEGTTPLSLSVDPAETLGVNTPEQLAIAQELLDARIVS